ncbi:hypothetical protein ACKTEK_09995 [Tepidamorphus sp. 3E244]|uniref:hypothetical protein n=1 Tax=Tepidamorphus sp. 3E244 TaxID=3385498 RepID=UPI0038FC9DCC
MAGETKTYRFNPAFSTRGLDTINAVYAFIMALGLTEVFIGSHTFITNVLFGAGEQELALRWVTFLFFLNVILLGMRFFWVPRNLRRLIYAAAHSSPEEPRLPGLPNWFISLNWFIIFLHGGLFYVICREYKFIMFLLSSNPVLDGASVSGYIIAHAALLIINGLWIGMLAGYEGWLRRKAGEGMAAELPGGVIWFRNNLAFSLLALAPFVVVGSCQSTVVACISAVQMPALEVSDVSPTSPVLIAHLYDMAVGLFVGTGTDPAIAITLWVLVCLLINSLLDLALTGKYYVMQEEVAWEEVQ